MVATYLFVGGLAGAAQIIATLADLLGGRRDQATVRAGRYLALAGALASPVLLMADLHVKSRWYNMLRIFRRTSAMSIGSWTLAAFGTLSGLVAMLQTGADLFGLAGPRRVARWLGLLAAGVGALMTVYTGRCSRRPACRAGASGTGCRRRCLAPATSRRVPPRSR